MSPIAMVIIMIGLIVGWAIDHGINRIKTQELKDKVSFQTGQIDELRTQLGLTITEVMVERAENEPS